MNRLKWSGVALLALAAIAAGFWFAGRHVFVAAFVKHKLTRQAMPHAYLVPQPMSLPSPRGEPLAWGRVSLLSPWGSPVGQKSTDKAVKLDFFGGRSLMLLEPSAHGEFTMSGLKPSEQESVRFLTGSDISDRTFYRRVLDATPDKLSYFGGAKETTALSVLCLLKAIGMPGRPTAIGVFETPQALGYVYKMPSKNMVRFAVFDAGGAFHDLLVVGPATDEELGALAASLAFR